MQILLSKFKSYVASAPAFLLRHKYHVGAFVLLFFWCLAYFTSGDRVSLGDFTFFAQGYEAMRATILNYHQFPWYNPWMSGGVPLFANPQMGVFSIQTIFVLLFGAVRGLKYAVVLYTFLGYGSMYLLTRKYFKLEKYVSTLLSLLWLFCTFFVAHLPEHFTFVWYMVAPAYLYLALTFKTRKGGLVMGAAWAVMALSQLHNPFFHITLICGAIIAYRLIRERANRRELLIALACVAAVFMVFAGPRMVLTYENVQDFPRVVLDNAPKFTAALLGPLLPLSMSHPLHFFRYPEAPFLPHGYIEATTTIGVFALVAVCVSLLFVIYQRFTLPTAARKKYNLPILVLGMALLCFVTAFGSFAPFAPYTVLKHIPVFSQMRVSTRWFLWFDLFALIFVGLTLVRAPKKSFFRFCVYALLTLGTIESFVMNVGYPGFILNYHPVTAPKPITAYQFEQTSYFGQTRALPGGGSIPNDGHMPALYREYEATTYNLGILYANDSLVQLALDPRRKGGGHPTCPWEEGCYLVLSHNAVVKSWSPNKIVFTRTGPGPIKLNMSNSNYFSINGKRNFGVHTAEPFIDFFVYQPDSVKTITLTVRPGIQTTLRKLL